MILVDVFIRNSNLLLDDKRIICGVHLEMDGFPTIDVGKTSGYASSVNYGSHLGICLLYTSDAADER